jgi:ribosomal-protein-alanine N-acetyltransferase
MALVNSIRTKRLLLRHWRRSDRAPFAALNADPRVREFFPNCLTRKESDASVDGIEAHVAKHGFGLWAVEVPGVTAFAGFIGLSVPLFEAHFTPCVEIGWRLAADCWGRGYASEGALACLEYGFNELDRTEIVSMTTVGNLRSRRVMEKIGMTHDPADDFDHPSIPVGHPLRRHVLYRIRKEPRNTRKSRKDETAHERT